MDGNVWGYPRICSSVHNPTVRYNRPTRTGCNYSDYFTVCLRLEFSLDIACCWWMATLDLLKWTGVTKDRPCGYNFICQIQSCPLCVTVISPRQPITGHHILHCQVHVVDYRHNYNALDFYGCNQMYCWLYDRQVRRLCQELLRSPDRTLFLLD